MFKTTGRLNVNLERSFSPEASSDIYNLRKTDGNLLSYIYSQDHINPEDSSLIHDSLIKNSILQNEKESNIFQEFLKDLYKYMPQILSEEQSWK